MSRERQPLLSKKKRYLQIALNGSLSDARFIIPRLPRSDRLILEAGTPLIKRHGIDAIAKIRLWYERHMAGQPIEQMAQGSSQVNMTLGEAFSLAKQAYKTQNNLTRRPPTPSGDLHPYVVADLKMMDRGSTEVALAAEAGASAAVALGLAPKESLESFIRECRERNIDSMIDMMNVDFPLGILRELREIPDVVVLHRGVDETENNKEKMLPLHEIRRIKGAYDVLIAVAGGDTSREIQSAMFNDADIAVVWKDFYSLDGDTASIAKDFLSDTK